MEISLSIGVGGVGRGTVRTVAPKKGEAPSREEVRSFELPAADVRRFEKLLAIYDVFDIPPEDLSGPPEADSRILRVELASGRKRELVFREFLEHEALAPVCRWLRKRAERCIREKEPNPEAEEARKKNRRPRTYAFRGNAPGYPLRGSPFRTEDPVPGPGKKEIAAIRTDLSDALVDRLVASHLDRIEKAYIPLAGTIPDGFLEWLRDHGEVRRVFWPALSPHYDDIGAAIRVLDALRREEPDLVLEIPHLAVALAVVRDSEDAPFTSRYYTIWAVVKEQFTPISTPLAVFRYFADEERRSRFVFPIDEIPWPLLVHVVDIDVSLEEARWALKTFGECGDSLGKIYHKVVYDHDKANRGVTKLGKRPYTLANLLKHGGVCGDQAHFCSRVCKSLGVPAMKVAGLSRYGGSGHSFACFLHRGAEGLSIASTGRYFHDFYYTGDVFDPQTRTLVLDRTLAMMLDGACLSYENYALSRTLIRMADRCFRAHPEASLALTQKAL
ncbi:MAG: hypothetical protein ACYS47_19970, partial [Planctomycetota bacterium]